MESTKVRVSARVTEKMNADIEKIAEFKGMTKSGWIVNALSNEVMVEKQRMAITTPDSVAKMINALAPEILDHIKK